MLHVLIRWSIPLFALLVLGPLAGILVGHLTAGDGGREISLLVCQSREAGILAGLVALALALAAGVLGARLIDQRSGLLAAGFVLAWAAWNTGRIDRILLRDRAGGVLITLAAEACLFGLLAIGVAFIILRTPTRMPGFIVKGDQTRQLGTLSHHEPVKILLDRGLCLALTAALLGSGLAAYLIAGEMLKGQTVFAAVGAGVLAAAFGRLASQTVSPIVFFSGVVLAAILGPVSGLVVHSGSTGGDVSPVVQAAADGTLFRLARPLPLDWLAGAFIGVPIGLWWAGSMIDKHEQGNW